MGFLTSIRICDLRQPAGRHAARVLFGRAIVVLGLRLMPEGRYRRALCQMFTDTERAVTERYKIDKWLENNRCTHGKCPSCGMVDMVTWIDNDLYCGECIEEGIRNAMLPCTCDLKEGQLPLSPEEEIPDFRTLH